MSGHSKWATIKRQKGAADVKRGQAFTKLSLAITVAVKQGGGITDPNMNFRLRLAIDAAKTANMPKENIERAIDRASGKQAEALNEVVYEGFGPSGVAVIVEGATDNKMRTTSEIQNIFNKSGGNMGQPGSVAYQFKQLGQLVVAKGDKSLDDLFLLAADAGAEDVEESNDEFYIYTQPVDLAKVRQMLIENGVEVKEEELIREPVTPIVLTSPDEIEKVQNFIEKLEDNQDVQKVYSNLSLDENAIN